MECWRAVQVKSRNLWSWLRTPCTHTIRSQTLGEGLKSTPVLTLRKNYVNGGTEYFNIIPGILGTAGSFQMFGLSNNRIWILARDQPWTQTSGSYLYEEGMIWPGFKPPMSNVTKFTGFSVVQLPSSDNKDKFFISGGHMDGAASTKAYTLDAMVSL